MVFARARPPSVVVGFLPAGAPRAESACQPDIESDPGDFKDHAIVESLPVAAPRIVRLKRRREFLAVAATGKRWVTPAFVLQVGERSNPPPAERHEIGLGFTATRRIGNAIARNRAKRRLREASRLLLPDAAFSGHDYVLVARMDVLTCAFQTLMDDLTTAFSKAHRAKPKLPHRPSHRART